MVKKVLRLISYFRAKLGMPRPGRVSPTNWKILFHLSHGYPEFQTGIIVRMESAPFSIFLKPVNLMKYFVSHHLLSRKRVIIKRHSYSQ